MFTNPPLERLLGASRSTSMLELTSSRAFYQSEALHNLDSSSALALTTKMKTPCRSRSGTETAKPNAITMKPQTASLGEPLQTKLTRSFPPSPPFNAEGLHSNMSGPNIQKHPPSKFHPALKGGRCETNEAAKHISS